MHHCTKYHFNVFGLTQLKIEPSLSALEANGKLALFDELL